MAEAPWRSAAPPPPPGPVGALPSTRLQSEIGPRSSEPPLVVQNAMMTKDKKPFTYTPGGIDLTEIRSPRMARRLEKNAASEGVQLNPQVMHNQPSGPLPPSALAAMQPAMPVQVFPNGQMPQLGKGGVPPPPPPLNHAGSPPPPPMQANKQANRKSAVSPIPQNYERPDMTKIIPENPMALLRKSPGPVVKQDPILNRDNYINSGLNPLGNQAPQEHLSSQQPQSPEIVKPRPQIGTPYSPPAAQPQNNIVSPPATLRKQPQSFENRVQTPPSQPSPPPFVVQRQRTQNQQSPDIPAKVKSPPPPLQRQPTSPESPGSPKVNLNKAPTPWLSQKAQQKDVPPWAVHEQNNEVEYSSPTQQPSTQLPGGARIIPMQQQSPQLPGGARIMPMQQPSTQLPGGARIIPNHPVQQEVQQKFVSNHNVNGSNRPNQDFGSPQYNNVVVNDPPAVFQGPGRDQRVVYQPGRSQQQQSPKVDSSGARIIPIQIEGASNSSGVQKQQRPYVQKISGAPPPIENRPAYNRQQSQSNSFRVLQKMTNTDVDVDNEPAIDCSPRTAQQFQQQRQVPVDQLRQMKLNDGDQEFVNRFKQDYFLFDDEDLRYKGGHIPSRLFWMLDEIVPHAQPINRVHQQPQAQHQPKYQNQNQNQSQSQARERTIPIQIEGNNGPKKYVPPSEQKVPEPKKYTGSAIPSRSFKILQAMTAPENCADPEPDSENYTNDPSSYEQWGPGPNNPFPYYYPYGPDMRYDRRNCATPTVELRRKKRISKTSNRRKSFPYSPSMENEYASEYESDTNSSVFKGSTTPLRDFEQDFSSRPRGTPVPFWSFYPPPPFNPEYGYDNGGDPHHMPYQYGAPYPPIWDPYAYYAYYYGPYPPPMRGRMPAFSPYMFPPATVEDNGDISGYSSADETVTCSSKQTPTRPHSVMRGRSETPTIKITSSGRESVNNSQINDVISNCEQNSKDLRISNTSPKNNENTGSKQTRIDNAETLDSSTSDNSDDSDTSCDSDEEQNYRINPLSTIPSVANVQAYDVEEQSENEDDAECVNEDDRSSVCCNGEAHLLSTIDELSERTDITDSKVNKDRTCDSDDETTAVQSEESDDEEKEDDSFCEVLVTVNIPLKVKHTVSDNRNESLVTTVGNSEIKEEFSSQTEHTSELFTSFTLRSPSRERTPGKSGDQYALHSETSPEGGDINIRREFVKQDSVVSCENESTDTDAVVKVVSVETKTVTEKLTISPTSNLDELKQEKAVSNSVAETEEEVDWWGKISEDTDEKNNAEIVVTSTETTASENEYAEEVKQISTPNDTNIQEAQKETNDEEEVDFWAEIIGSNDDVVSYRRNSISATNNSKADSPEMEEQDLESQNKPVLEHSVNSSSISSCNNSVERNVEDMVTSDCSSFQEAESSRDPPELNCESLTESSSTFVTQIENVSECEEENKIEEKIEDSPMYIATSSVTQTDVNRNTENEDRIETVIEKDQEFVPLSIKERIKALENARKASNRQKGDEDQEIKISVKDKVSAIEENNFLLSVENYSSKRSSVSGKNSVKSFEECSEVEDEEIDSGVTSDISKHVSEHEADQDFPNLRKMNKYQRASTHSRLFKLLQDEIEAEDEAERLAHETNNSANLYINRDHLDLPLKTNALDSESGINSPASPVINEGLVNELVQSLLMKKQAKIFKKMPMEKLQAAAVKILKEDVDVFQQSPDEVVNFLSPVTNCTADSTAIHTPQEFYSNAAEYMQYYDSWGDPDHSCDFSYDILPSKVFKFIQEHTATNKTGSITGFTIKCPRVLSSKNILNDPSPVPPNPPQQNEAASAS
ncbi:uncharacterized protein LOC108735588 isoform X2 [Agrilus planipennis]|uniref:Uncharacterized protein LOC108735588 isoform X2 n=1 Tax=Agrilus planipennis TaxID=224129 RepID=A0A1W4WRI9_AGRPL|nr:uncharacterized protein LOC108735588 isoform X2 [Agrilus planipennis]